MKRPSVLILGLVLVLGASAQETAGFYLAKLRGSLGVEKLGEMLSQGLSVRGDAEYLGVKGSYSLICDASGRFVEEIKSELSQVVGFDGRTGWTLDYSNMPRKLDLEDLESEQAVVWIFAGRWLTKDSPFTVELGEKKENLQELKVKLRDQVLEGIVTIDTEKWLPVKYTRHNSAGDDVWEYSDFKRQNGFALATTLKNTTGGMVNTFRIKSIEKAPTFIRDPYAPRMGIPKDTTFDGKVSPEVEVKRAFTGHLLIHPLVNGQDIGWFIFDSGAGAMVIDPKAADALKMPKIGQIPAVGVGGLVKSSFRRADSFTLGPATMKKPLLLELDLAAIGSMFGVKVGGICGYDLISRTVVEVNLSKPAISVFNPVDYKLVADGVWQDILQDGKHPIVRAKFEGDRSGWFRLDTGASNALVFHTPAVERYKLLDERKVTNTALGGVGGFVQAKAGKIEWFEIGGHRFVDQYVEFSTSKDGPFSDPYTLGNIGQKFLMPFIIVFDYQRRRMAFLDQWK
jgi:hypothetical protein